MKLLEYDSRDDGEANRKPEYSVHAFLSIQDDRETKTENPPVRGLSAGGYLRRKAHGFFKHFLLLVRVAELIRRARVMLTHDVDSAR